MSGLPSDPASAAAVVTSGAATSAVASPASGDNSSASSTPIAFTPYCTVVVKAHVPTTLDMKTANYSRWSKFFRTMCAKFGLLSHIDGSDIAHPDDPAWTLADSAVLSWLYGSVADDVLDSAMADDETARDLWVAIEGLFRDNKESRAVFLSSQFHSLLQGDQSIADYSQRIKTLADALRDVGHPVSDSQLVLNLLRGLNPRYSNTADDIANATPFPSFARARSMLALKETRLANEAKVATETALLAGGSSVHRSTTAPSPVAQAGFPASNTGNRDGRRGGRNRRGKNNASNGAPARFQGGRSPQPAGPWFCFNPWSNPGAGQYGPNSGRYGPNGGQWRPSPTSGLLGPPPQAHIALAPNQPSAPSTWDQQGLITALNQLAFQGHGGWVMDSGATSHMASNNGMLITSLSPPNTAVTVGNGSRLPITSSGHTFLPTPTTNFSLRDVLIVPHLVRNLLSVRKFTRDNNCSLEFDAFGFSIKDLQTRQEMLRCNSEGDLYTIPASDPPATASAHLAVSSQLWHQRLGHPGVAPLASLHKNSLIECNNVARSLCQSCQLGKHARLPFATSTSRTFVPFELIHCDVWTSPVASISGSLYYLVVVDDFSHFCWTFPLKKKSDVHQHIVDLAAYAGTQFGLPLKSIQADNGREFVNLANTSFFASRGIALRLSCPYTSPQNGKAERMLRTLNNAVRTLLLHAHMPPRFWAEALATATYLLNRCPSTSTSGEIPYTLLHQKPPQYSHLRVFGCLCFPNLSSTAPHKLAPRSAACAFLGYPSQHKGYRCLDLATNRVIISRHVVFDENTFPFASSLPVSSSVTNTDLDFLVDAFAMPVPCTAAVAPLQDSPAIAPPTGVERSLPAASGAICDASHRPPVPLVYSRRPRAAPPSAGPLPPTAPALLPADQPVAPVPASTAPPSTSATSAPHQMVTRSRAAKDSSAEFFSLMAQHAPASAIPTNYRSALADPNWRAAMNDEYKALMDNLTWRLVPRPHGANIVSGKWIFKHKFHSDGRLARYKARWVVRGFSQQHGIDYDETFSPVVKPATIRTVLSIATSRSWPIHQLDVKNAFLHGTLNETVYCQQPSGFVDPAHPDHVCLLQKSLYGLKQAPRAWYQRFATYIRKLGYVASSSDTSLFVLRQGTDMAYLLLYVDDIIITASSTALLQRLIGQLRSEFAMTDLGDLHFFLGISVTRSSDGLFLSQRQFAVDLLRRAGMTECHPTTTPVDTHAKLSGLDGAPVADPSEYRSLAGALQYLTLTRPDLAYAVQQVCLFMHDPREPHLALIKRILRYVKGTLDAGLHIGLSPATSLTAYSDADWAGCPDSRRSTSGYCVFLGDNLVSWSSKRQTTVSRSSAEAEYRAVAHVVAECCWLRHLLQELHVPLDSATVVYCDNVSAIYMSTNPVQHRRTKHIEIDIHFVREKVSLGEVRVLHVPSSHQFADIMTKGLPTQLFQDFRSSLCVRLPPAATAGGY